MIKYDVIVLESNWTRSWKYLPRNQGPAVHRRGFSSKKLQSDLLGGERDSTSRNAQEGKGLGPAATRVRTHVTVITYFGDSGRRTWHWAGPPPATSSPSTALSFRGTPWVDHNSIPIVKYDNEFFFNWQKTTRFAICRRSGFRLYYVDG